MQTVVSRWGEEAIVRIPYAVLALAGVVVDQPVDVREEGGRIVIEKLQPELSDLDTLLAGITDLNIHDPVESEPPVGREVW